MKTSLCCLGNCDKHFSHKLDIFQTKQSNQIISGLSVMRGIVGCSTSLIVKKLLVDFQLISFSEPHVHSGL